MASSRYEPRRVPVDIVVSPLGNAAVQKDNASLISRWNGTSQVEDGESFVITFTVPEPGTCLPGSCHIEVRDINLKMRTVATSLSSQLAALFNDRAMLPPGDAVLVHLADRKVPPLYVSRFVLQLRSPVFRAEFASCFAEAASQELSLDDFSSAAVSCFLEMLHADEYTGTELCVDDIVALFALGDKYDVAFVQEYAMNELSTRSLDPGELRTAFIAAGRHHTTALKKLLVKRLRWLSEDNLCTLLDATWDSNTCYNDEFARRSSLSDEDDTGQLAPHNNRPSSPLR